MIKRPSDIFPPILIDELLRVARANRDWVACTFLSNGRYLANVMEPTWLEEILAKASSGADAFSMHAASIWLLDGPKIFHASPEHCHILENVDVCITLSDYTQPFETLLVDFPDDRYAPFTGILCHKCEYMLTLACISKNNKDDITTTVAIDGRPIEESLTRYDDDCAELGKVCGRALRVAVNSCLVLCNFGHHWEYMFPREVERDVRLSKEKSFRGETAAKRIEGATRLIKLDREVILHGKQTSEHAVEYKPGEETDRTMPCHWRRGHWRMQNYGPKLSLRKRIFVPPVLVRADLLTVAQSETTTSYR